MDDIEFQKAVQSITRVQSCCYQVVPKRNISYEFEDDDDDEEQGGICDGNPEEDIINVDNLQVIWSQFARLVKALRALPETDEYMEPSEFQETARQWASDYRKISNTLVIIPYIHCKFLWFPPPL